MFLQLLLFGDQKAGDIYEKAATLSHILMCLNKDFCGFSSSKHKSKIFKLSLFKL